MTPPDRHGTTTTGASNSRALGLRRRHERSGRRAEWLAAAWLLAKGYRLLARRHKTPYGEIDLIAVRGRRLVFCEVKHRATLADAERSVSARQAARIAAAAQHWTWRHARYRSYEIGLDCVYVTRGQLPRHVENALQPVR